MLISFLISKMRSRCIQLSGYDPYEIVLPFTNDQIHRLFVTSMDWQIAIADFIGEVHNHFPKSPLITIAAKHKWIIPIITKIIPLPHAPMYFTDTKLSKLVILYPQQRFVNLPQPLFNKMNQRLLLPYYRMFLQL